MELTALGRGLLSACADDLGIVLAALRDHGALLPHLQAAQQHAGLRLQPKKCVLVPTWSLPTPEITASMRAMLTQHYEPWQDFSINSFARYLG
eukprot:5555276-Pyramimonas_sp.AAC.1